MKKLAITLCLLGLVSQGAFAYLEEGKSSDIGNLQERGYSQEALKLIDLMNYQNRDMGKDYQMYYERPNFSEHPQGKWYTVIKRYIDPVQDDNLFGRHEIHFSNTWFDDAPNNYITRSKKENKNESVYTEPVKAPEAPKSDVEQIETKVDVESL